MAITNFVPEIWAANILSKLRSSVVFGQLGVINRDYEGEIAEAGDTVHITAFDDPTVEPYVKNVTTITYEGLTDEGLTLVVDQSDYFAIKIDDIDKRQALPGSMASVAQGGAWKFGRVADAYIAGEMSDAVPADNILSVSAIADPEDAYDVLVDLGTVLDLTETPDVGRWVVLPPEFYGMAQKDDRFVNADKSGSTQTLRTGYVGDAAGFTVFKSTRAPGAPGSHTILAGHGMATTYAEQINQVEAMRLESAFADGLRGLHLYGAKVIRPEQLAKATVWIGGEFS